VERAAAHADLSRPELRLEALLLEHRRDLRRGLLVIAHRVVSIAPGKRYDAWTFGNGAPGPIIHVRQGRRVDTPGIYPFVSHSFASVAMGEVGLLDLGNVPGTMNH